jgi:hypothetical protein
MKHKKKILHENRINHLKLKQLVIILLLVILQLIIDLFFSHYTSFFMFVNLNELHLLRGQFSQLSVKLTVIITLIYTVYFYKNKEEFHCKKCTK